MGACLVCCTADRPQYLARMLSLHVNYPWVDEILVFTTNKAIKPASSGKVSRAGGDYGHGFDKAVGDGGFNEIEARCAALELARCTSDSDWLLIVDDDEIFTFEFGNLLDAATRAGADAVQIECWPLLNEREYLLHRDRIFDVGNGNLRMHDPHIRAVRRSAMSQQEPFYVPSPKPVSGPNKTQHCRLNFGKLPTLRVAGFFHFHLKDSQVFSSEDVRKFPGFQAPAHWFVSYGENA